MALLRLGCEVIPQSNEHSLGSHHMPSFILIDEELRC